MKTYLYNGIELPALPTWTTDLMDRELTNALIVQETDGSYWAHASYDPITFDGENFHVENSRSYSYISNGEWTPFSLAAGGEFIGNETCIWSNHDIINTTDGSVYLAASDPVPPSISGVWKFNETITQVDAFGSMFIGNEGTTFVSNGVEFNSIRSTTHIATTSRKTQFYNHSNSGASDYTDVYVHVVGNSGLSLGWIDEAYRTIDFGDKQVEPSAEFYEWLTANAVPYTPEALDSYLRNGEWQKNGYHMRVNGEWVKQKAYRRMNGAWVEVT